MVDRLQDAVLLTWEGDGHTAFPKTDCINAAVTGYLVDLEVPEDGASCPAADDGSSAPTDGSAYALDREMLRRQIEEGFTLNGTEADLAECIARPLAERAGREPDGPLLPGPRRGGPGGEGERGGHRLWGTARQLTADRPALSGISGRW